MSKVYKYIKPLDEKPQLPSYPSQVQSKVRMVAREFVDSDLKYAEVKKEGFKSHVSLARSLGRVLHSKTYGLDREGKIKVVSDRSKGVVYLIRE